MTASEPGIAYPDRSNFRSCQQLRSDNPPCETIVYAPGSSSGNGKTPSGGTRSTSPTIQVSRALISKGRPSIGTVGVCVQGHTGARPGNPSRDCASSCQKESSGTSQNASKSARKTFGSSVRG